VYDGRLNVGYSVDGCCDGERDSGRSGRTGSAVGQVDRLRRSWKILRDDRKVSVKLSLTSAQCTELLAK
jgi:hypothetical protein